jgi:hypothetical protein
VATGGGATPRDAAQAAEGKSTSVEAAREGKAVGDGISKEKDRNPSRSPWIDRSGDKELGSAIGGR